MTAAAESPKFYFPRLMQRCGNVRCGQPTSLSDSSVSECACGLRTCSRACRDAFHSGHDKLCNIAIKARLSLARARAADAEKLVGRLGNCQRGCTCAASAFGAVLRADIAVVRADHADAAEALCHAAESFWAAGDADLAVEFTAASLMHLAHARPPAKSSSLSPTAWVGAVLLAHRRLQSLDDDDAIDDLDAIETWTQAVTDCARVDAVKLTETAGANLTLQLAACASKFDVGLPCTVAVDRVLDADAAFLARHAASDAYAHALFGTVTAMHIAMEASLRCKLSPDSWWRDAAMRLSKFPRPMTRDLGRELLWMADDAALTTFCRAARLRSDDHDEWAPVRTDDVVLAHQLVHLRTLERRIAAQASCVLGDTPDKDNRYALRIRFDRLARYYADAMLLVDDIAKRTGVTLPPEAAYIVRVVADGAPHAHAEKPFVHEHVAPKVGWLTDPTVAAAVITSRLLSFEPWTFFHSEAAEGVSMSIRRAVSEAVHEFLVGEKLVVNVNGGITVAPSARQMVAQLAKQHDTAHGKRGARLLPHLDEIDELLGWLEGGALYFNHRFEMVPSSHLAITALRVAIGVEGGRALMSGFEPVDWLRVDAAELDAINAAARGEIKVEGAAFLAARSAIIDADSDKRAVAAAFRDVVVFSRVVWYRDESRDEGPLRIQLQPEREFHPLSSDLFNSLVTHSVEAALLCGRSIKLVGQESLFRSIELLRVQTAQLLCGGGRDQLLAGEMAVAIHVYLRRCLARLVETFEQMVCDVPQSERAPLPRLTFPRGKDHRSLCIDMVTQATGSCDESTAEAKAEQLFTTTRVEAVADCQNFELGECGWLDELVAAVDAGVQLVDEAELQAWWAKPEVRALDEAFPLTVRVPGREPLQLGALVFLQECDENITEVELYAHHYDSSGCEGEHALDEDEFDDYDEDSSVVWKPPTAEDSKNAKQAKKAKNKKGKKK